MGTNIDWAGQVVEGIRGKRLGEVLRERVFAPLGMEDIGFTRTEDMKARTATIHARGKDGSLSPMDDFALPDNPEVDMIGHGGIVTLTPWLRHGRCFSVSECARYLTVVTAFRRSSSSMPSGCIAVSR